MRMRVAVVHNRDTSGVINVFGSQNRERYNPRTVERVAKGLEAGGHTVRMIDGKMHIVEQLQDFMLRVIAGERPGMVFGIQGRESLYACARDARDAPRALRGLGAAGPRGGTGQGDRDDHVPGRRASHREVLERRLDRR